MSIEELKNIGYKKREYCMICEKKSTEPLIALPGFPLTEIYSDKKIKGKVGFADQYFHLCDNCKHGQIVNILNSEFLYGNKNNYYFRTSESDTGRQSTNYFLNFVGKYLNKDHYKLIIEVGCNDLYLLNSLSSMSDKLLGIDPILRGQESQLSNRNIIAVGDFFENFDFYDNPDIVICKDTIEHIENPKEFVRKIVNHSHNGTLFFMQFPLLETLLLSCRFDQIFHQHLNYFSYKSISYMLHELGCEVLGYEINVIHWGAILIAFKKGGNTSKGFNYVNNATKEDIKRRYNIFKKNMDATNAHLKFLKNETLYGYGAALMLPILSYHLNNDFSSIKCIIDDDERKNGLYYINLPVQIRYLSNIEDIRESVILITAIASISNTRKILLKVIDLNPKHIIIPICNF